MTRGAIYVRNILYNTGYKSLPKWSQKVDSHHFKSRVEVTNSEKHSSLLLNIVNYDRKSFMTLAPGNTVFYVIDLGEK
jgi:hypothetical protein